ncbi:hypothetical protein SJ05684_b55400 (plasmid) [Sinorhizobium sojae CCBAU 05684]|uniref:DUF1127 domain-containing protein n=1 Tax=Sinorhizobium sojae CCBAU 05684 TaxID=716928 RepID=A0A249PL93_9HYPH|nr:DUF1127 domain-containing protein [Sinorhizobium sojae]ASY66522.1 hypothetical protein SJ05684_b55400 [Sinorhizobium sojae CCBAU 05684]
MSKTSFKIDPSAFLPVVRNTASFAYAAQFAERIRDRRQISHARRRALHEMPDHIVKDIGVTRFEIDHLCFGRARNWRTGA